MLLLTLLIVFVTSSTCSEIQSRQKRAWIIDSYEIEEGHPGPFPYKLGQVGIDRKYQVFFDLYGQGIDEEPKGVFTINKNTGEIFVQRPVDYEEQKVLKLSFEAKKTHDLSIDTRLGVEILIRDINDNPPLFEKPLYEVTVDEDLSQGSHIHTVVAYDRDQKGTPNSTFHYAIKSVSPQSPNIEFFIKNTGALSFKGCLDHEVASKHTLLIEAIDHGEVVQLSSSTTVIINVEDGNNHLPVITGQTGSGKVKENESGVSPLRLHVTDHDVFQSKAWRVEYTILGNEKGYFNIETDRKTNDGILTVVKSLDFEEEATKELKISVKNEAPYFSCEVKSRPTMGLWNVDVTKKQSSGGNIHYNATTVIIEVVDVNEPPEFTVTVKEASLPENTQIGTWVEKVTAVDQDTSAARDFIYKVGDDPEGWMEIDADTGDITTIKMLDRESPHVVNGFYTLILHAMDKGQPPMTGTATLQIHLIDINDNVPKLDVNYVDVCLSDSHTPTEISATDPDGDPFGGPFQFELLGDIKGKWKLDPSYGFTAGLVRDSSVYAGLYTLKVKVSDQQGEYGIYSLNTTVCSCSVVRNCRSRNIGTFTGEGAIGIILASLVLLLLVLLAAVSFSCKEEFDNWETIPDNFLVGQINHSNVEKPGTDCKVPNIFTAPDGQKPNYLSKTQDQDDRRSHIIWKGIDEALINNHTEVFWREYWSMYENRDLKYHKRHQVLDKSLRSLIQLKLCSLQETVDDLPDYEPYIYAEEGDLDIVSDLDRICFSDGPISNLCENLGPEFEPLASICMLPQLQNQEHKL
ncbi:hypothetical protein ILYODFUR_000259 [Ilyodon furcidens]|uniref:Cadherin domain-containing protein n=1 Tax=Ilyodon furcidens TaxID=33524 RepID=A0ABV0TTL8_9TELE